MESKPTRITLRCTCLPCTPRTATRSETWAVTLVSGSVGTRPREKPKKCARTDTFGCETPMQFRIVLSPTTAILRLLECDEDGNEVLARAERPQRFPEDGAERARGIGGLHRVTRALR